MKIGGIDSGDQVVIGCGGDGKINNVVAVVQNTVVVFLLIGVGCSSSWGLLFKTFRLSPSAVVGQRRLAVVAAGGGGRASVVVVVLSLATAVVPSSVVSTLALAQGSGLSLGGDFVVPRVKGFGLSAVKVEPPIADEVLLVEDGAVGAEQGLGAEGAQTVGDAHVEHLAFGGGVGVVPSFNLSVAVEFELGDFFVAVDGVVLSGGTGHGLQEPVETLMVASVLALGQSVGLRLGLVVGLSGGSAVRGLSGFVGGDAVTGGGLLSAVAVALVETLSRDGGEADGRDKENGLHFCVCDDLICELRFLRLRFC